MGVCVCVGLWGQVAVSRGKQYKHWVGREIFKQMPLARGQNGHSAPEAFVGFFLSLFIGYAKIPIGLLYDCVPLNNLSIKVMHFF